MSVSQAGSFLWEGIKQEGFFASLLVPGLPQAGTEAMLQSWQLVSLPGQNSIPNCLFSSTSALLQQLHAAGVSKFPQ